MSYVSFNDVIELNGILKDKGLNFRIHLRDTCGRQSFWIEPLGPISATGTPKERLHGFRNLCRTALMGSIRFTMNCKFVFRRLNSE